MLQRWQGERGGNELEGCCDRWGLGVRSGAAVVCFTESHRYHTAITVKEPHMEKTSAIG